eukprot:gene4438-6691_t
MRASQKQQLRVVIGVLCFLVLVMFYMWRSPAVSDVESDLGENGPRHEKNVVHGCVCPLEPECPEGQKVSLAVGRKCCSCVSISPAPEQFRFEVSTTKGDIILEAYRDWAPQGVERLYELIELGFCDPTQTSPGLAFFRVIPGFIAQFGIHGDPKIAEYWRSKPIPDDPVLKNNHQGTLVYAAAGPNSRTTQMYFNLRDNIFLDAQGFSPIAKIISGLDVVESINSEYKQRPNQHKITVEGDNTSFKQTVQVSHENERKL